MSSVPPLPHYAQYAAPYGAVPPPPPGSVMYGGGGDPASPYGGTVPPTSLSPSSPGMVMYSGEAYQMPPPPPQQQQQQQQQPQVSPSLPLGAGADLYQQQHQQYASSPVYPQQYSQSPQPSPSPVSPAVAQMYAQQTSMYTPSYPQLPPAVELPPGDYARAGGYEAYGVSGYSAPPAADPYEAAIASEAYASQHYEPKPRSKSSDRGGVSGRDSSAAEVPGAPEGSVRYQVTMLPSEDGGDILEVVAQVGLDGVKVMDIAASDVLQSYPMTCLTGWKTDGKGSTTIQISANTDDDKRKIIFAGDAATIKAIEDMMQMALIQLCELAGVDTSDVGDAAKESELQTMLEALAAVTVKDSDDAIVAFWEDPEHQGWLMKTGEHIRNWRRRWVILKSGRLFWFKSPDVSSSSKPRGVIHLKKCSGVIAASASSRHKHALELQGDEPAKLGAGVLIADTDRERDEWVKAIKQAMEAGNAATTQNWSQQLQDGLQQLSFEDTLGNSTVEIQGYTSKASAPVMSEPPSPVSSSGVLPSGWEMAYDATDRTPYYYNRTTGMTQWERPTSFHG